VPNRLRVGLPAIHTRRCQRLWRIGRPASADRGVQITNVLPRLIPMPIFLIMSAGLVTPGGGGGGGGSGGGGGGGGGGGCHLQRKPVCSYEQQHRQKHSLPSSFVPHLVPLWVQSQPQLGLCPGQALVGRAAVVASTTAADVSVSVSITRTSTAPAVKLPTVWWGKTESYPAGRGQESWEVRSGRIMKDCGRPGGRPAGCCCWLRDFSCGSRRKTSGFAAPAEKLHKTQYRLAKTQYDRLYRLGKRSTDLRPS
jgi:hypothetical protein